MRNRSPAKSAASSPPVPARISMMTSRSSIGSGGRMASCTEASRSASRFCKRGKLLLRQRGEFRVAGFRKLLVVGDLLPRALEFIPRFRQRLELAVLAQQFAGLPVVIIEVRLRHERFQLGEAVSFLVDDGGVVHGSRGRAAEIRDQEIGVRGRSRRSEIGRTKQKTAPRIGSRSPLVLEIRNERAKPWLRRPAGPWSWAGGWRRWNRSAGNTCPRGRRCPRNAVRP